jgi:acetyl/propionyl-CoA carboxylase alpha subunit/acetyl-CoA carboxylase carboxyltransferase component
MNKIINYIELKPYLEELKKLNPYLFSKKENNASLESAKRRYNLQKVLIANRGEIAKRFFLILHEEGIKSAAVVTDADKGQSWYEFADEVVFIGGHTNYSNPHMIIAATLIIHANAIYSGYGFLSENSDFVKLIDTFNSLYNLNIIFMGPGHETIHLMGDKINARKLAQENGIPLFPSSGIISSDGIEAVKSEAGRIGYPVMIKLCAGGGGKGMYSVHSEPELEKAVNSCMRIGTEIYNNSSFYIEKFIKNPIHIEVQIFNGKTIGIRKCAVQRRNQKIIEESGETFIDDRMNLELLALAEKIAYLSDYSNNCGAGTVEFLIDQDSGQIGFLEMNTRLQVEYGVTDQSLGIDLAKCHILLYDGRENEFDYLDRLKHNLNYRNHSIECRIYAEDPENDYQPSPGIITEIDLPTFNGIRCDFGFSDGDKILPMYDPMIGKLIVHGQTRHEALIRTERALQELYIKGVKTNIPQLLNIVRHPEFAKGDYNNRIISIIEQDKISAEKNRPDKSNHNHIIFGAFVEYIELLKQTVSEFFIISNAKGITNTPVSRARSKITVEHDHQSYTVEFIQLSFDSYYTIINDKHDGKLILNFANEKSDDIILMYHDKSYRVRVDRKNEFLTLKLKDDATNKINYYNLKIIHDSYNESNNVEIIRSPFQGTFISFCNDVKSGDKISIGDPLFVLSAMKMETTICSTVEGRVTYIFTDEYNSKSGENNKDKAAGKTIREGEILIKIETSPDARQKTAPDPDQQYNILSADPFELFLNDSFESVIIDNPENFMDLIITFFYAIICGFITQDYVIEKLHRIIRGIKFYRWKELFSISLTDSIEKIVLHYIYIKKIFSSTVSSDGVSFCEELDIFIIQFNDSDINLSPNFNSLFLKVLDYYGIPETDFTLKSSRKQLHQILFYMKHSYRFILDHPDYIKYIVYILPLLNIPQDRILEITGLLLEREEAEKDDTLAKYIKNEIYNKISGRGITVFSGQDLGISDIKYLFDYPGPDSEDYIGKICRISLNNPEAPLIPDNLTSHQKQNLDHHIALLNNKYNISRLKSPIPDITIFRLEDLILKESLYTAFSVLDLTDPESENVYETIEKAAGNAAAVVSLYQDVKPGALNWIHIIIKGMTLTFECNTDNSRRLSFSKVQLSLSSALTSAGSKSSIKGIFECDFQLNGNEPVKLRKFFFNSDNIFEFIYNSDSGYLYHDKKNYNPSNQKIISLNKWPVEIWAEECFDSGTLDEIRIESIDYYFSNNAGNTPELNNVGAKIFTGKICGNDACFFMKDSGINGGATGDLEGLKYIAAAYISFLKGWPFYVWNDGAGANIKEGIVSLNRGAEGFMMNSLLVNGDYVKFRNYIDHNPDAALKKMFKILDKQFRFNPADDAADKRRLSVTAVGIGSSAGLDVYGSSQAVLQIMLDSNESYRVLTGSNVIQSVIGEKISNYEIGGAEILGRRAGIIDLIADNKIHLINTIRKINSFFSNENRSSVIKRIDKTSLNNAVKRNEMIILTEEIISANVDDGEFIELKKDYYGAESVIGGLAKIGGHHALILGTRTHFGHRSSVSVIKTLELLNIAHQTSLNEILIFGKNWLQPEILEDNNFRPQLDFMNAIQKKAGLRIHIIMHADGLKLFYLNNAADIIIFIRNSGLPAPDISLAARNSTFIVDSLEESFDLSCKIIDTINPADSDRNIDYKYKPPSIPSDPAIPYDIINSVILPLFDDGSFIEFYKDMNTLSGSSLITGIAKLNGVTTGIIADQPLLKGGAADAYGTEKFRVFTQLLNRLNIPLIMLSNSSGFLPGSKQERLRIQVIGAESLDVNILGQIPVVSVVLNQNYGGRLIHAFNKFLRPGIVYLALENSILAVIGVNVAFDLLYKKEYLNKIEAGKLDEAEKFKKDFYSEYLNKARASAGGIDSELVDWIIPDQNELRKHLIKGMDLAVRRCREAFSG